MPYRAPDRTSMMAIIFGARSLADRGSTVSTRLKWVPAGPAGAAWRAILTIAATICARWLRKGASCAANSTPTVTEGRFCNVGMRTVISPANRWRRGKLSRVMVVWSALRAINHARWSSSDARSLVARYVSFCLKLSLPCAFGCREPFDGRLESFGKSVQRFGPLYAFAIAVEPAVCFAQVQHGLAHNLRPFTAASKLTLRQEQ